MILRNLLKAAYERDAHTEPDSAAPAAALKT